MIATTYGNAGDGHHVRQSTDRPRVNARPRRILAATILGLLTLANAAAARAETCDRVDVGAIRWDAWYGDNAREGLAVERSLGQPKWKDRWPAFQTEEHGSVEFNGTTPAVIESEMRQARDAGIDYWAFTLYRETSPMGRALNTYLSSKEEGPKFTVILSAGELLGADGPKIFAHASSLLANPRYFRGKDRRPVIFVMVSPQAVQAKRFESLFENLSNAAEQATGESAQFVIMSANPDEAWKAAQRVGATMISAYAWAGNPKARPYRELASGTEDLWERQVATGASVVPLVMTGWDPRPRIDNPVPWAKYPPDYYYLPPSISELSDHMAHGIERAKDAPRPSCMTVIYAWNEFDEGGWLAPTRGEGSSRLDALRRLRRPDSQP